jgi:hypothetical protein
MINMGISRRHVFSEDLLRLFGLYNAIGIALSNSISIAVLLAASRLSLTIVFILIYGMFDVISLCLVGFFLSVKKYPTLNTVIFIGAFLVPLFSFIFLMLPVLFGFYQVVNMSLYNNDPWFVLSNFSTLDPSFTPSLQSIGVILLTIAMPTLIFLPPSLYSYLRKKDS